MERIKKQKAEERERKKQKKKDEKAEREWIEFMKGQRARDTVKFGEVNSKPPQNLHALGAQLFGKGKAVDTRSAERRWGKTAEALTQQRRSEKMRANYELIKKQRRKTEKFIGR